MNRLLLSLALCLACHSSRSIVPSRPPGVDLRAARAAFERYALAESRSLYQQVEEASGAKPEDRAAAALALATYAFRFDRDAPAALRGLDRALDRDGPRPALLTYRGRVRMRSGDVSGARADAERALALESTPSERAEAQILLAEVAGATQDPTAWTAGVKALEAVLTASPGHPEACEALLGLSLRRDDGPGVLRAFRCYFFLTEDEPINAVLQPSHEALVQLARAWQGRPLSGPERQSLIRALAGAAFYDLAVEMAAPLPPGEREKSPLREITAYHQFLLRLRAINDDFYPRAAKGLRDYEEAYDRAVEEAARALWTELGGAPPMGASLESFFEGFFALLRERFRVEGYLGTTMGFYGMLAGHTIHDERRPVAQHGHVAEFRYVSIDRLLSRDFTSWYGTTNVGGWGTESTMFQVRDAYTEEPFQRLAWVTDPAARARALEELATLEREDLGRCAADPYAHPSSVSLRLRLAESDRLWAALGQSGRPQPALAFIAESLRLNVEATVFAHEGRHALDQRYRKAAFDAMSDAERELRAKYSEVAFASNPRLALTGSILGAADERTGHGQANRRFRELLVDWMRAHSAEIPGLSAQRPLVMQLHLLSDEQLLTIVRGADRF